MIRQLFKKMVMTQIISSLAATACLLIDSIMIGRFLGIDAMAAYGFSSPILLFFAAMGTMLSVGVQVTCSRHMADGKDDNIGKCFAAAVTAALAIAIAGVFLIVVFVSPLAEMLGAEEGTHVFKLTKDYLIAFSIGSPIFLLAQVFIPFMQMAGKRSLLITSVICMTVGNIAFNFLNIFVFRGGTFGMGLASSLSYYVGIIPTLKYFLSRKCLYKFRISKFSFAELCRLGRGGLASIINSISYAVLVIIMNNLFQNLDSSLSVAAFSVVTSVGNVCYCVGSGIGGVSLMLAGMFYNEEDRTSLKELIATQAVFALALDAVVSLIVVATAKYIAHMFLADNREALKMTVLGIRVFALCLIPSAHNSALKNYYLGITRVRLSEIISVLQNLVYPGLVALLFGYLFGVNGMWFSFLLGETLTLFTIGLYVRGRSGLPLFSSDSLLYLPDSFGVKEGEYIEFSATNASEVEESAAEAEKFCISKGAADTLGKNIALCIREMGMNTVTYGIAAGEGTKLWIRVIKKEAGWIIRLRDNCSNFDPVAYLELHSEDVPNNAPKHGIRLVTSLAKDVRYVNSMGLNNLIIEMWA